VSGDVYGEVASNLAYEGYVYIPAPHPGWWASPREQELMRMLDEAVEWARRPSPLPVVPFDEFLERVKPYCGPRADPRIRTALAGVQAEEQTCPDCGCPIEPGKRYLHLMCVQADNKDSA